MVLDYTWERREEMIRKEEREEGREQGLEQGRKQGREQGQALQIVRIFKKNHASDETILAELVNELQISSEHAKDYLTQYGK
jgi:flagellar biosynthesis/type III secretory pathway protein FliH